MVNDIPNINFESNSPLVDGVEIITLESLKNRNASLNHNPQKEHQLTFNMLVFYVKGKSKHLVDFVWHEVRENTLIHISKNQVNAFSFNENLEGYLVLFTDEYLEKQIDRLPKSQIIRLFNPHLFSPRIQVPETSNVLHYFETFLSEFSIKKNDLDKQLIYNSLFTIIFSKLEQLKQDQTFHIKQTDKLELFLQFKNLIEIHYTESRNADFYASKLHITYKHLNSICKEIIDSTAKSFIDGYIILEAKRKLVNSSIKSSELAFKLGFDEPTNFVKYFKKFTKLTPNSFKKSI